MKSKALQIRVPALTVALAVLAWLAWIVPAGNSALEYSRDAIAEGQLWRIATGHFTHWTPSHLTWDLATFTVLGAMIEMRSRMLFASLCGSAVLLISGAIWCLQPELVFYRGLSGIDSALFATAAVGLVLDAIRSRYLAGGIVPLAALVGIVAKTVFELMTGQTLFVATNGAFAPVPLAHLTGLAAAISILPWNILRRPQRAGSSATQYSALPASPYGHPTSSPA